MEQFDAYVRISVLKSDDAPAVANQISALQSWAKARGAEIVEIFKDEGISATSGKTRPAFEAIFKRSVNRPIVVWKLDRLSRSMKDLQRILDAGILVHSLNDSGLDLSTPTGRAIAQIFTTIAALEVETKTERQKLRTANDAAKGKHYWRTRPFGWNQDGTLHLVESSLLRTAAQDVLQGKTLREAYNRLSESRTDTCKAISYEALRGALTSERIAGIRVYDGQTYQGSWESICTEDEVKALSGLLTGKGQKAGRNPKGLLSAFALCPKCGHTLYNVYGKYVCGAKKPGTGNRIGHFSRDVSEIDRQITSLTLSMLSAPGAIEDLQTKDTPDSEQLRIQLGKLRGSLVEWEKAAPSLGPAEYLRITAGVKKEISDIEEQLFVEDRTKLFEGLSGDPDSWHEFSAQWDALELSRKREIIRLLFDSITITEEYRNKSPKINEVPSALGLRIYQKHGMGRVVYGIPELVKIGEDHYREITLMPNRATLTPDSTTNTQEEQ